MSDEQKAKENEVFDQELSLEDLDAATGGAGANAHSEDCLNLSKCGKHNLYFNGGKFDADTSNCVKHENRNIYGGNGFPNCAATVGDGSRCANKDACYSMSVTYRGNLDSCSKAWRLPPRRVLLETLVTSCGGSRHVCRNKAVKSM